MSEVTKEDIQRMNEYLSRLNDTLTKLIDEFKKLPKSIGLTNKELRDDAVEVDTGLDQPLTDSELRASPIDVNLTLTEYNEPFHYELGNNNTINIAANTVGSISVFVETGNVDISINGAAAITYSTVGVYSWGASELLDKSFDITTDGTGIAKILVIK